MVAKSLDKIFNKEFNESLVHQVTTDYLSNQRSGTKAQKNRSAVSGGGAKPRPQKGSGRARAGTTRGPIWRSGGVTFAAKPKDYNKKINKKMYKSAMNCILSELVRKKRLICVEDFNVTEPKTKSFISELNKLKVTNTLLIVHEEKINVFLAGRNLKNVEIVSPLGVNPYNLMRYDNVVIDSKVIEKLQGMTV
ncbi:MAG: 50S ribosomal protein L4 [Gammaproteobacteria bacterium TMED257]|nr:MAG: 50S ribosomal protein L4 [Gammaproteobacteria bacterium TMED257]|tara:strand:+ start:841 stop:1419 length:579 start_codon:yes stop_codon:yes gene_type:complete